MLNNAVIKFLKEKGKLMIGSFPVESTQDKQGVLFTPDGRVFYNDEEIQLNHYIILFELKNVADKALKLAQQQNMDVYIITH
jgi:hypothetical protein